MRAPRRVHCCSGPALALKTLRRGARTPELQMGWSGGEVLAGGKQGRCPCPRLPGAGGSARPYLGGGIRGGDDRVPRRSRRHLSRGAAAAHGLGLGRRRAPSLRLLRTPLLRGAPGSHDFFTVLPRPAARCCLLQIAGTRGRAREAVRPQGPKSSFLSRSSFQRAQTANEGDALAANSLKEKKKKKATSLLPPPPPCCSLASSHAHSPDTPCGSISPQAAGTQGAARVASQGPGEQPPACLPVRHGDESGGVTQGCQR